MSSGFFRPVREPDKPWRMRAAAPHLKQTVVAFLFQSLFVPDLYIETNFFRDSARSLGQIFRRRYRAGFIDDVAGFIDSFGNDRVAIQVMPILLVVCAKGDDIDIDLL